MFYSDASSFWVTLYNLNYRVPIEKVAIGEEKVAIGEAKVAIEQILNVTGFTNATKQKIRMLFEKFGVQSIIGRSDIAQVTGDSLTAAGKLINKMKDEHLIEPVSGHGKGKYRFKLY